MLRSAATLSASGPGTYHHHDALGNVVALTNAASYAVLETYTYDPFGKRTVYNATGQQIPDTAYANIHGYTGREHLPLHGLMDYRNRSYSTILGRFLQAAEPAKSRRGEAKGNERKRIGNPIRFEAGDVNLYRYVSNNPVNYFDPLGLMGARPKWIPVPGSDILLIPWRVYHINPYGTSRDFFFVGSGIEVTYRATVQVTCKCGEKTKNISGEKEENVEISVDNINLFPFTGIDTGAVPGRGITKDIRKIISVHSAKGGAGILPTKAFDPATENNLRNAAESKKPVTA